MVWSSSQCGGGGVAAGPAAGQVAGAHEIGQRFGGPCSRVRVRRSRGGSAGPVWRSAASSVSSSGVISPSALISAAGAVLRPLRVSWEAMTWMVTGEAGRRAPAAQSVRPQRQPESVGAGGQRPHGISAARGVGARVVLTHGVGQLIQALIQGVGVGGKQAAADLAKPVECGRDPDLAAHLAFLAAAHRVGVDAGHDRIDFGGQPPTGQRGPTSHVDRDPFIDLRQHLGIHDQLGARHDRGERVISRYPRRRTPARPAGAAQRMSRA